MKKVIAALCLCSLLTGCGDSDEIKAQALVNEARGLWDQVMPGAPEVRGGNIVYTKEGVIGCVDKFTQARGLLDQVAAKYSSTSVWSDEKTVVLNKRVSDQKNICTQMKAQQGW